MDVIVGSSRPGALATRSRYASRAFVYPHPLGEAAEFRKALLDVVRGHGVDLTIPVSESTCAALAAGRDEFQGHSRLALSSNGALAVVLSRAGTRGLADRLGIPTAPGIAVRSVSAGLEAAGEMGFPVVVAPDDRVSPAAVDRAGGAQYAVDRADLVRALNPIVRIGAAHLGPPLQGDGIGLAVLCRRGSVLWAFQCRRLHELGPGDGVGAYRISEPVDPTLLAQAQKLMRELSWEGAAELQFRRSDAGYCLTNVSATFADGLPVAVAAGADAPSFLYDLEVHDREDFGAGYRIGARCRHLPSEIAWTRELARPKTVRSISSGRPRTSRVLADMARALSPWEHWDTQSISDLGPGVQELREVSTDLWRSVTYRLARVRQRRRMRRAARHPSEIATRVLAARTILFVCLGNIIRSAFAAGLLGAHSAGRPDLRIRSAGLDAATDHTADPTAVQCARRFGVDLSTHRTRRIDRSAVEEADILLAMELDHVVEICRRFPQYRHKVYLFGCLTDENAPDVADPVYGPQEVFDACFDRIDRGIRRLVEMWNPASIQAASPVSYR
jgi:protein-tyrosine-phosphatase